MFVRDGFASVTTTGLCRAAGVTRGALYHHFVNMNALMAVVYERCESHLVDRVERALGRLENPRDRLLALGPTVLDVLAEDPTVQRIVFVEGPSALEWSQWRALDAGRSVRLISEILDELNQRGELVDDVDPRRTAQLILGAINEAGMYTAAAESKSAAMATQVQLLCRGLLRT